MAGGGAAPLETHAPRSTNVIIYKGGPKDDALHGEMVACMRVYSWTAAAARWAWMGGGRAPRQDLKYLLTLDLGLVGGFEEVTAKLRP